MFILNVVSPSSEILENISSEVAPLLLASSLFFSPNLVTSTIFPFKFLYLNVSFGNSPNLHEN